MLSSHRIGPRSHCLRSLALCLGMLSTSASMASTKRIVERSGRTVPEFFKPATVASSARESAPGGFKWNVGDRQLPLLGLPDRLPSALDQSLAYPMAQLAFPIFQSLNYDDQHDRYVLPAISRERGVHFVEFAPTGRGHNYASVDGSNIQFTDNGEQKTIRTSDGAKLTFVRYPDGEFRCASIKDSNGAYLSLLYTANGLMLHGVVDAGGRTVTFNYGGDGIESVTQTWMANSEGATRTWAIGERAERVVTGPVDYSTSINYSKPALLILKALPVNALVHEYTPEMAAADRALALVFGGPGAVAAGRGFEPIGLAAEYPFYRGDIVADDGRELRGHLSFAMHLYGNAKGTGDSPLYVPAGFVSHNDQPSSTDAVVSFYYPRLGNLTDVTLAVFHVADFQISYEGDRVRIGNLGGPGGSSALYKHSHIEFYRGDVGLPPLKDRAPLRIDPATVFGSWRFGG